VIFDPPAPQAEDRCGMRSIEGKAKQGRPMMPTARGDRDDPRPAQAATSLFPADLHGVRASTRQPAESIRTREGNHEMVKPRRRIHSRRRHISDGAGRTGLETSFTGDALDLYRTLRSFNPSPYMFCFALSGGLFARGKLAGSACPTYGRSRGDSAHLQGPRRRGATEGGGRGQRK